MSCKMIFQENSDVLEFRSAVGQTVKKCCVAGLEMGECATEEVNQMQSVMHSQVLRVNSLESREVATGFPVQDLRFLIGFPRSQNVLQIFHPNTVKYNPIPCPEEFKLVKAILEVKSVRNFSLVWDKNGQDQCCYSGGCMSHCCDIS